MNATIICVGKRIGLGCIVLLTVVIGQCERAAAEENLVLKRGYDYWPKPDYGPCVDDRDIMQLTDGETRYSAGMWILPSTVGWAAGVDVPVVIWFDLSKEATLSKLRFNSAGGGGSGVVEVGLRVYVSLDNQNYFLAGKSAAPVPPPKNKQTSKGVQLQLQLNGARARYVAVVAMPPPPHYFVFVDEIELMGTIPANPKSALPVEIGVPCSGGVRGLQEVLAGGQRSLNKLNDLARPLERHLNCWPKEQAKSQREELKVLRQSAGESKQFEKIRAEITASHRNRARQVYGAKMLVWEVVPDDAFTMLSLPEKIDSPESASIHTVINALEATALGVANLADGELPLNVTVTGGKGAPRLCVRTARFFTTSNARYIPDALLAEDCPQVVPSGESRLIWLEADSANSQAGVYDYEVRVRLGESERRIALKVHIHNVTLSHETPLANGNWAYLNVGESPALAAVRDSMLSHRITVGALSCDCAPFPEKDAHGNIIRPLRLDFSKLDKSLAFHKNFAQVSIFWPFTTQSKMRPHYDWFGDVEWMSDEFKETFRDWMSQVINRIKASGRDYDAFYFQMFDETLDERAGQICQLVHSVDPKVRMMMTIPTADRKSTKGIVTAGMNIFMYHAPTLRYDNAPDGFGVFLSGGRELWIYNAADSAFGLGKETDPLGWYRYAYWTAFRHGASGVHFWNMLYNNGKSPVWIEEPVETAYYPLVYPIGSPNSPIFPLPPTDVQTAENVIPSRRWEYVRMGIEDYMLLSVAKERIGALGNAGKAYQKQLDGIVKEVITNRNANRNLFRAKRLELVELVEKLVN